MTRRYKSIDVAPETHEAFTRMAEEYGMSNKDLLACMVQYFNVSKADPRNPKADNPTDAIKALDKRIISFIRQQEKEQLRPMASDLQTLLQLVQNDLPKTLRQSQLRTLGGAIKPELLNERFLSVYEELVKNSG